MRSAHGVAGRGTPHVRVRWHMRAVLSVLVVAGTGCGEAAGLSSTSVASVQVTPASAEVAVGRQVTLTARVVDLAGAPLLGRTVTWNSSDEEVATVDSNGTVRGVNVGDASVTATSEGKTGTAAITVSAVQVASVTMTPSAANLVVGQTLQLQATPRDSTGNALTGRVVVWSTEDSSIAAVNGSGLVSGVAAGTVVITATSEGTSGTATITVTLAPVASVTVTPAARELTVGDSAQLIATLHDSAGYILTGRVVAWTTEAPGVATVNATGAVTGVSVGTATITATSEGVSGSAVVTVVAAGAPGPLRVDAANGRYFSDGVRPVLLTGSHTWSNFEDNGGTDPPPVFDYTAYLDSLEMWHHNFFRLWAWEQSRWTNETSDNNYWFSPGPPFQRTGPGTALDGKPKWDVTKFDQGYFDRLRARVIAAGQRGIYVSVMLFDGWSMRDFGSNNPWKGHPFNASNNINGIDGDPNGDNSGDETHTLAVSAVTAIQEAYVRKVIDAVNDLDNVLYEISNESQAGSVDWQYHMIDVIKAYEATKAKQHPVGMTVPYPGGDNADLYASPADWVSPNGSMSQPPAATGQKVVLWDTDHLCGVCGDYTYVWKAFTQGENPIFMDLWDGAGYGVGAQDGSVNDPAWPPVRKNLGYVQEYAARMNLEVTTPHGELASSGYCLANPTGAAAEYLVFLSNSTVQVDLSGVAGNFVVEWFDPRTGDVTTGDPENGGGQRNFTSPFGAGSVLYLHR